MLGINKNLAHLCYFIANIGAAPAYNSCCDSLALTSATSLTHKSLHLGKLRDVTSTGKPLLVFLRFQEF